MTLLTSRGYTGFKAETDYKRLGRSKLNKVTYAASNRKSSGRKAQRPGLFEVQVVTPPRESLGIHAFHPNTHNGDQIQVEGKDFIVSSLVLRYKLVKGKYQRDHNRLDVQELSRYFLNLHLDHLMKTPS